MIKRIICSIILLIICYILQTTLFWHMRLAGVVPNLLLILTVSSGYINGHKDGIITALMCGLMSDLIFGSVIGLHALIYVIIGFLSGYGHNIYLKNNFSVPLVLIGICDMAYGMLYYVFEFLLRGRLDFIYYFNNIILPEVLYTMLAAIVFFKIIVMVYRLTVSPENREEF